MALLLRDEDLFCPACRGGGDLWVSSADPREVNCKECRKKWNHAELKAICRRLIKRAKEANGDQHRAACLRILMQHTINPFTGRCLA